MRCACVALALAAPSSAAAFVCGATLIALSIEIGGDAGGPVRIVGMLTPE